MIKIQKAGPPYRLPRPEKCFMRLLIESVVKMIEEHVHYASHILFQVLSYLMFARIDHFVASHIESTNVFREAQHMHLFQ